MTLKDFTSARVQLFLQAEGLEFDVLDDDDIVVGFENGLVFHSVRTEPPVWAIRSTWRGNFGVSDIERAREVVNAWNQDMPFPKVFLSRDDDDEVWQLNGEIHCVTAGGITEGQLEFHHRLAMGTSFQLFELVEKEFPHLVTWEKGD